MIFNSKIKSLLLYRYYPPLECGIIKTQLKDDLETSLSKNFVKAPNNIPEAIISKIC